MRRFGGLSWALPVAALVVVADQLTKRWALGRLRPGGCDVPDSCIDLIFGARFHLIFNTGAAFNRGENFGPVLGVLATILTVVLLTVAWRRTDKIGALLLGTIAGGAIGNLVDRVARAEDGFLSGAVVDFVDLGWWPVFNVADAAVVCGVLAFIALSWSDDTGQPAVPVDDGDEGSQTADRVSEVAPVDDDHLLDAVDATAVDGSDFEVDDTEVSSGEVGGSSTEPADSHR